jgi:hypothetical protein
MLLTKRDLKQVASVMVLLSIMVGATFMFAQVLAPDPVVRADPMPSLIKPLQVEQAERVQPVSRSNERDPLEGAMRFSQHLATFAPPTPTPSVTLVTSGPTAEQWADLRQCEAGGDYTINTGNGYYGAYQFDLGTWHGVGGVGYPHEASPAEQDLRAQLLYDDRGAQPWPVCGQYLS